MTSRICLATLLAIAVQASWADDEMTTEVKPGAGTPPAAAGVPSIPANPGVKSKLPAGKRLDPSLRAKIRKRAPFWIEDANHSAAIQINKDGTFSSEAQGGGSIAGQWKALQGELLITWSDGEEYVYPIISGKSGLLIHGHSAKKNRFKISGH